VKHPFKGSQLTRLALGNGNRYGELGYAVSHGFPRIPWVTDDPLGMACKMRIHCISESAFGVTVPFSYLETITWLHPKFEPNPA
jgi:hypothetical protein